MPAVGDLQSMIAFRISMVKFTAVSRSPFPISMIEIVDGEDPAAIS